LFDDIFGCFKPWDIHIVWYDILCIHRLSEINHNNNCITFCIPKIVSTVSYKHQSYQKTSPYFHHKEGTISFSFYHFSNLAFFELNARFYFVYCSLWIFFCLSCVIVHINDCAGSFDFLGVRKKFCHMLNWVDDDFLQKNLIS
jgi:hypothetical protein